MEKIEDLISNMQMYRPNPKTGTTIWIPAFPLPMYSLWQRVKDGWLVFRGRATAVQWPQHRDRYHVGY